MSMMGDLAAEDQYDPMTGALMTPSPEAQGMVGRAVSGAGALLKHLVPRQYGEALAGRGEPEPEIPGQITEGDVFRSDMQARRNALGAAQQAVGMFGLGAPAAITGGVPRGAFGATGGRGKGPSAPVEAEAPGSLFDYSRIGEVPDVRQFDLPRYDPKRGVSERVQDLIKNKKVERQMLETMESAKGIGPGAQNFYGTEPLRDAFVAELGKKKGPEAFATYMDYTSGTSPRSKVAENARNASYYYTLDQQGKPMPAVGDVNPQPYGHMAQKLHQENARRISEGGWDVIQNPKPPSFSQNLQGNFDPVTVDAHAFKLPAMLSRDPRFLAQAIKLEKGVPTINPTKMFESGDLTMKEALKRPVYWGAKPNPNEYGAMEQYYKNLSREVGMTPAQGQAAAWAGGGPTTGLGSVAGEPFIRSLENRANITAAARGISPQEALSQFIRGKRPLLSLPPAAAMGALAAQDGYER